MLNNVFAIATSLRQHLPFSVDPDLDIAPYYHNHVAAITGAGSGMGRELAIHLAKMGCHVALSDINTEKLIQTKEMLVNYDIKATTTVLDVSDNKAVEAWADNVMAEHGKVNFIFNNAGVALYSTVEGSSISELEWVMDINFWGVVYGTKAFLPLIKNSVKQSEIDISANKSNSNDKNKKSRQFKEHGHVVNISSLFGLTAQPSQSAYNASKFAVRGFTEALRQELARSNVAVSCVHPGGIKTNIARAGRFYQGPDGGHDANSAAANFDKLARTSAEQAAQVIVDGILRKQPRILIGADARLLDRIQRLLPSAYPWVLNKLLGRR